MSNITHTSINSSSPRSESVYSSTARIGISDSTELQTPVHRSLSPTQSLNPDDYDDSAIPRIIKRLDEVYNETEEVFLDEELFLMGIEEPMNYSQAVKDRNCRSAMENGMQSIEENNTWKLTKLPTGKKTIGLKWIFILKKDAEGNIIKYKAR